MIVGLYVLLMTGTRLVLGEGLQKDVCDWHRSSLISEPVYSDCRSEDHRLVCFGGINDTWKLWGSNVRTLILCHWPNETFDPVQVLRGSPSIRKFSLINGNLTRLTSPFPANLMFLETVNLTGTKVRELPREAFTELPALKVVDLRNNGLREIDPQDFPMASLGRIYLSGNPLRCTEKNAWILDMGMNSLAERVVDREKLRCSEPYEQRPLVPVLQVIMALKEECKKTVCECELVYVVGRSVGKHIERRTKKRTIKEIASRNVKYTGKHTVKKLMVFNSVNCSHRGLAEMPDFLPANTTTLRLSGNKIADLSALTSNPLYERVLDLYLDDNDIASIVQLEGSYWLDHFRLLSLRGNRLNDLPTYALENVLLQSNTAASLYLGENPWRCDCLFTPGFQDLLVRYTSLIKDLDDVKCADFSGDDNSGKQIRYLTRTEICTSSGDDPSIHPLDVLNIVLASLIFLVLGKLLYDYWSFKKTGKLPWIVAKLP